MTFFAFWRNDYIVYIFSALIVFLLAPDCFEKFPEVAFMFVILACYFITQALLQAMQSGGSARGWSQFKGYYDSVKDHM